MRLLFLPAFPVLWKFEQGRCGSELSMQSLSSDDVRRIPPQMPGRASKVGLFMSVVLVGVFPVGENAGSGAPITA